MSIEASAAELLENDGSAFGRNTLLKEIDAMAFRLKKRLDQGVGPDEKEAVEAVRTAVEAARQIVESVWAQNNH